MRYIIYGAGAVGGSIGARLHRSGHEVLLIARGEHFRLLNDRGLHYRNPDVNEVIQIPVVDHPDRIHFERDDVVLMTMKSQHSHDALLALHGRVPAETAIVCCQNGVANERLALRFFANVYAMVVMLPGTYLEPGEVCHFAATPGGALDCGRFPGGTDETVSRVTGALTDAGFISRPDPRIMRWKYAKLLQNLGNSLQALCSGDFSDLMSEARREALACYAAAGVDCADREESSVRYQDTTSGRIDAVARGGGSSWQSMQRGTGDIETDYLNGEIAQLGRRHGIPTPVNAALQLLAARATRQGAQPGSLTPDDILAEVALRRQNVD